MIRIAWAVMDSGVAADYAARDDLAASFHQFRRTLRPANRSLFHSSISDRVYSNQARYA